MLTKLNSTPTVRCLCATSAHRHGEVKCSVLSDGIAPKRAGVVRQVKVVEVPALLAQRVALAAVDLSLQAADRARRLDVHSERSLLRDPGIVLR